MRRTLAVQKALRSAGPGGQTRHMQPIDLNTLSVSERIQLVEDLRDSIAAETGDVPLTDAQIAELGRRLADMEHDPQVGDSWEVVRARIQKRLSKAG
jgi:putative addiction module component (TIGR02574 family)